jgi:hypothetical protein
MFYESTMMMMILRATLMAKLNEFSLFIPDYVVFHESYAMFWLTELNKLA